MQTKSFDPAALAGLTTGILMTDFSDLQEAAEHVIGHPIWTHQLLALQEKIKGEILRQFPDMPTDVGAGGWEATRDAVRERYGAAVEVHRGAEEGISPLDPAGFPDSLKKRMAEG